MSRPKHRSGFGLSLVLSALFLLTAVPAHAINYVDEAEVWFARITTMKADFTQIVSDGTMAEGGRAYNSTQELLLLNLHLKARPKHIVVFSGVNNLTLAYLCKETSQVYNSFFGESEVRKAIDSRMYSDQVSVRRAITIFGQSILSKLGIHRNQLKVLIEKAFTKITVKYLLALNVIFFLLRQLLMVTEVR